MERNWDMDEVSDGKRYQAKDMVKLGCNDCAGCSNCCKNVGTYIVLDPYDIYQLEKQLQIGFQELISKYLELHVIDSLILPSLKMVEGTDQCVFLNEEGRCRIHLARPGICRLFPLGRIYENGGFSYFLQVNECKKTNRTKLKIQKWLGIPQLKQYEDFVVKWHYYLKDVEKKAKNESDATQKALIMKLLQAFFVEPYDITKDFYEQFEMRMQEQTNIRQ